MRFEVVAQNAKANFSEALEALEAVFIVLVRRMPESARLNDHPSGEAPIVPGRCE